MRASERLDKRVKPLTVIVTEEQHQRLRIRAAIESCSVSDLIRVRLADIIDPEAEVIEMAFPR